MNKNNKLKLNLQFFGGGVTLYEMKQNLSTVGQQLEKVEKQLGERAVDPNATTEEIQTIQKTRDDLKARFDIIKEQHDGMEAEQKKKFQEDESFNTLSTEEKQRKAKAEFIRASLLNRTLSNEAKQLIAIPSDDASGGDNFLPTTLANELVHEPFARNPLREVANVTAIKGLELPKISYQIDDDDFITDKETAKELKLKGDTVSFGRNKFKVKASISDTVLHGSDVDLVGYVDNALRSGLANKERRDAFAETPDATLKHMSFYSGDVKTVKGDSLFKAIKNAIADLHEDYRENAQIVMSYADYMDILESLANGNATFYNAPPEQVLGKPVTFSDSAVKPVVGDFSYFGINYDGMTYDSDKDVDSGNYLFVLTAWYDQQRSLNSAFRVVEVDDTPEA